MQMSQDDGNLNPQAPQNMAKKEQVIDYISQMLAELAGMAADVGHDELSELICFSSRAAKMEKSAR